MPQILYENDKVRSECLIGPKTTPCFTMDRYILKGGHIALEKPASIWICTEGSGVVTADGYERPIAMGDYFFLPAAAAGMVHAQGDLTLVCCAGGQ